jgi:hypothetical protein
MEEIVDKPASVADLKRLEADIEEALITAVQSRCCRAPPDPRKT